MLLETATAGGVTDNVLLGLIATLVGALIFVLKATMKRSDDLLKTSRDLTQQALAELKKAVDTFTSFREHTGATSAEMIADLRSLASTQERILTIQQAILDRLVEIKELNQR